MLNTVSPQTTLERAGTKMLHADFSLNPRFSTHTLTIGDGHIEARYIALWGLSLCGAHYSRNPTMPFLPRWLMLTGVCTIFLVLIGVNASQLMQCPAMHLRVCILVCGHCLGHVYRAIKIP